MHFSSNNKHPSYLQPQPTVPNSLHCDGSPDQPSTVNLPSADLPVNWLGLPGVALVAGLAEPLLTVGAAPPALSVADALAMIDEASAGEIVRVLVEVLADAEPEPVSLELPVLVGELDPAPLEPPPVRASLPRD